MPNVFDQIGKQIGKQIGLAALSGSGPTVVQDEIPSEVRYADEPRSHDDETSQPQPRLPNTQARLYTLVGRTASKTSATLELSEALVALHETYLATLVETLCRLVEQPTAPFLARSGALGDLPPLTDR